MSGKNDFLGLREKWLSWFNDDLNHSISKQIYRMLWDDAIFRLTNEMRRITSETESTGINADISHLIDRGYVSLQATAIRSLIDGSNDVISLSRIIEDLKKNVSFLTRENYVCHIPKDNEALSERQHETFDALCGTQSGERKRNDQVPLKIFCALTKKLTKCNDIKKFTDKFIAHKADSQSLKSLGNKQRGVTLDQISQCHQAILGVGNSICSHILGECELGGIPTEQYNLFENLEKPWTTKEDFDRLEKFWDSHKKTVEKMRDFKPW